VTGIYEAPKPSILGAMRSLEDLKDLIRGDDGLQPTAGHRPRVVFFDAVGTLFGVEHSVGRQYAKVAARHGVVAVAADLDLAFYAAFKQAGSPAFPNAEPHQIPQLEYDWWKEITRSSFATITFADFDTFFADLFAYFASAEPWFLYPETIETLKFFNQINIPIGIVSNFDSRLYSVLRSLSLDQYFQSVTISTEVGSAKPDGKIFTIALAKQGCEASQAWHVGDSRKEDYEAATAMGLRGILVDR
jgi:putative hydrolase of the HAD superfamily